MTKGTFGDHLKREREMRGVSLDEISAATRIATRFLRAIENEQWDQLPGGVFNRGFVRAVAHYLGLDEENIVAEYALAAGDRQSVPVWTGSPPAVTADQHWLAWILTAVVVIALIAGGWFGVRRIFAWRAARRAAGTAVVSVASDAQTPPLSAVTTTPAIPALNSPPDTPGSTSATDDTGASQAQAGAQTGTPAADTAASQTTAVSPDLGLALKIEANKKTRIGVEADGHRVFDGTMKAGESHRFKARDKFQISAGDSGALLLELNGQTLAPIGAPGQAGKVTLTRDALKGAAGGGN